MQVDESKKLHINSGNEDSSVNRSWTTPTEIKSYLLEGLLDTKRLIFKVNRKRLTLYKNSCGESEKNKTNPGQGWPVQEAGSERGNVTARDQ